MEGLFNYYETGQLILIECDCSNLQIHVTYTSLHFTFVMIQTASEFISKYFNVAERVINQDIDLTNYTSHSADPFVYSYHCHEATLAFAYALNNTITGKYL